MDVCPTVTIHMIIQNAHENINLLKALSQGTWMAQWKEHATLNFRVVSLSPSWGLEITEKKKKKMKSLSHQRQN